MIILTQGDLFTHKNTIPVVHCISEKGNIMGMGFAKQLANRYPNLISNTRQLISSLNISYPNLLSLSELDITGTHYRQIVNLITKDHHYSKPTYHTLKHTLMQLKWLVETYDIEEICMPLIGCGLDKLQPDKVIKLLKAYIPYDVKCYVYIDKPYLFNQLNKYSIYVSYYANDKNIPLFLLNQPEPKVGISLKQIDGNLFAKELYPTWDMIKNLKDDQISYEKAYREQILSKLNAEEIAIKYNEKVLRCFEAPYLSDGVTPQFCHRKVIASWLKEQLGDKVQIFELRNKYCETDTLY